MKNLNNILVSLFAGVSFVGCGSGSSSSDGDNSGQDPNSIQINDFTPSTLAISLPKTLTSSNNNDGNGLLLVQEEPSANSSQGYWELTSKVERIHFQLAELTLNNAVLDNVYASSCSAGLESTCSVENACATITQPIINNLKSAIGEQHFESEFSPLAYFDQMLGQEHCFPNLTLSRIPESTDGFAFQAVISFDENNSITQSWSEDKKKVRIQHSYRDDFSGAEDPEKAGLFQLQAGASEFFSGSSTFVYDANLGSFKVVNKYSHTSGEETSSGEENFTIQSLDDKLDLNGVVLKGTIESEYNGDTWTLGLVGDIDDNGGFVRTNSGWTNYQISSITLSAACEAGSEYAIFPANVDLSTLSGDDFYISQLGTIFCSEASVSPDPSGSYIYKQLPANLANLKLAVLTYPPYDETADPANHSPTIDASSITLSAIASAPTTSYHCYEEEFSATGELTAWRSAEGNCKTPNLNWVGGDGSFGGEYSYDESQDYYQAPSLNIAGVSEADIKALSGFDDFLPHVYIVQAGASISAVEAHSEAFYSLLIGQAWAEVYDAEASSTDTSNYYVEFWGTEEQIASAQLYVEKFDEQTGALSFVEITGASLQNID